MTKFFEVKTRNNKKKDFSRVDTSTQRGMGRYGTGGNSAATVGPRVGKAPLPLYWLIDGQLGIIDTTNNALVERD